jgi:hypothetical protein
VWQSPDNDVLGVYRESWRLQFGHHKSWQRVVLLLIESLSP